MTILWDDELSTGHARIDEQHRILVSIFNGLFTAIAEGRGQEEVGRALSSLTLYVVAHFHMEESLMAERGFPGEEAHIQAHVVMRGQVEHLVETFQAGTLEPQDVMDLLMFWVVTHVKTLDRTLAEFMAVQPS
jgi:hemerythrin-like metal-binding protein